MAKVDYLARLQAQAKYQAEQVEKGVTKDTQIVDVTVLDLVPTQRTATMNGVEMKIIRIVTKEFGNHFIPEPWISNAVSSFGDGVKAKMHVQENNFKTKDGAEVEGTNVVRLQLETISAAQEMAIKMIPKGAALQLAI